MVLPVLMGVASLCALGFMFTTMMTEPGILPTVTFEEYEEADAAQEEEGRVRIMTRVLLDGREYELRHFRAKFSRYTGNCVEKFDHFCPWVGNVVGKRNYRYFVLFLSSCLALAVLMAVSCSLLLVCKSVDEDKAFVATLEHSVAATVLAVYGYCMCFSLTSLYGFHIKAIATNTTTNEAVKGVYAATVNPHDQGCTRNCSTFWCAPAPRSRVADYDSESPLLPDEAAPIRTDAVDTT